MAAYTVSTVYLTTTRGTNGGDEMAGSRRAVERATWTGAANAFREAVFDATSAQGLRDREAGWTAKRGAEIATASPMKRRDHSRVVNIGGMRVRLSRVA